MAPALKTMLVLVADLERGYQGRLRDDGYFQGYGV